MSPAPSPGVRRGLLAVGRSLRARPPLVYAAFVAKIIVDVMLKPEIHDPQGEAIAGACHRLGFTEVVSVRQGKRFEVEVAESDTSLDTNRAPTIRVAELATELLANPVIEVFAIHDV
jgi:phosphoribosylformylglycinamidine synthase subunit PurS